MQTLRFKRDVFGGADSVDDDWIEKPDWKIGRDAGTPQTHGAAVVVQRRKAGKLKTRDANGRVDGIGCYIADDFCRPCFAADDRSSACDEKRFDHVAPAKSIFGHVLISVRWLRFSAPRSFVKISRW